MKLALSAFALITSLGILIGIIGAQQNIHATAEVFESITISPSADQSDDIESNDSTDLTGSNTDEQYVASMSSVLQSLGDGETIPYQRYAKVINDRKLLLDEEWLEKTEQISIRFNSYSEIMRQAALLPTCLLNHGQILSVVNNYDRCAIEFTSAINGDTDVDSVADRDADDVTNNAADADNSQSSANSVSANPVVACVVTADSNLRAGPDTTYDVVGGRSHGDIVYPVATNAANDWVQLDSGEWIAAWLLNEVPTGLPIARF